MAEVRAEQEVTLVRVDDGDNGRGILSTEIKYGTSDSASTQPSSWGSAVPTSIEAGKWLWVRTVINYTDNTSDTTYQKSYVGTDGKDGKSVFIQSATKDGDTTTVVIADSDGNTNTLTIVDGQDGPDGKPGASGYVHTAWANSADGKTDFSTTVSAGKKYLGVYTDNTQTDSTKPADYSWSLIKGDKGDQGDAGASFNWNLLLETKNPVTWTVALNTSNYMVKDCYKTISPVPKLFAVNDLVTIAFDWETDATGGNFHVECGTVTPYGWGTVVSAEGGRSSTSNYVDISSSKQSGHFKVTFKVGTAQTGAADTLQWLRIRVDGEDANGKTFTISNAKAERGSTASDWCTAESEVHGKDGLDGISASGLAFLVNHWSIGSANNGECCFFGYNDKNEVADVDGWVMWNGQKLTITKGPWINPNKVAPYNTPILHVFRTKTSPYHADVWWDSTLLRWRGYMYTTSNSPGTVSDWTWDEATDCILAMYVEPDNEAAIVNAQLFTPPKKFSELPNPSDIHSIVDTSIDAIEIGGKNLLRASEKLSQAWTAEQATIDTSTGIATLTRTGSGSCRIYQLPANAYWTWEAGVEYTISVEAKASEDGVEMRFDCNSSGTITYDNRYLTLTTAWKRYSCTFTITGTVSAGSMTFLMVTTGKTIYLRKPMLERGNKPSDWSPAPEDEVNARKLLIREVTSGSTQGIEVGYENGSYKAFINAAGSFDVINAAGDTVASFGTNAVLKSTKTDSSGTTTSTMTIMPEGMMIDQDLPDHSVWENRQQANITPYGIKLTDFSQGDSKPTFQLDQYVCGVWGTPIVRDWETMELGNMDGNCYCSGYITGSSKKLRFTMPLTVPISYRSKLEFDYLKVTVRQNNKYLLGDADTPFEIPVEDDTKFTCEVYDTGVNILYDSASAFSGATNNDACGIYVEYSMTPTEIST